MYAKQKVFHMEGDVSSFVVHGSTFVPFIFLGPLIFLLLSQDWL
jgi:hypothetical protein